MKWKTGEEREEAKKEIDRQVYAKVEMALQENQNWMKAK